MSTNIGRCDDEEGKEYFPIGQLTGAVLSLLNEDSEENCEMLLIALH